MLLIVRSFVTNKNRRFYRRLLFAIYIENKCLMLPPTTCIYEENKSVPKSCFEYSEIFFKLFINSFHNING